MTDDRPYFYGQGKVYLSRRNAAGQPLAARWVGDVSSLSVNISFDETIIQHSVGGVRVDADRYIHAVSGTVDMNMHEFSNENLSAIFCGDTFTGLPAEVSDESLPDGIQAGERYFLKYQQIWHAIVTNKKNTRLTEGTHYSLDKTFGAIEFLTTPESQPLKVSYERAGNVSTAFMNIQPEEFYFRYEGLNMAENMRPVVVELYRISFSPADELALINSDNSIGSLDISATLLADITRKNLSGWGRFGRVVNIEPLSGLVYDGTALHDGNYHY